MNRIIFVPGKNLKPPPELHSRQLLRCLLHAVHRIDPGTAAGIEAADAFSLAPWNYLFYGEYRKITSDIPWIDRLLELPPELQMEAPRQRMGEYRLARFLYRVGDALPWLIPLIPDPRIKLSIRETCRYFRNEGNIACKVREILKNPLRDAAGRGERIMLIGHSMGSIIAWDALWELHHLEGMDECVDCFLTIGSPLGMRYVQRRLAHHDKQHPEDYPGNIRHWVNVAARGDLVALDPLLARDFSAMVEAGHVESIEDRVEGIYNYYRDDRGLNVHKSYGYMTNPVVAELVADWWKGA